MPKKLSICIPTFNRSQHLEQLLQNLSRFSENTLSKLDLCISNNCSSDETDIVVNRFINNLQINYFIQPKNIGVTFNVFYVMKMASSPWILTLGDDDLLSEDGILYLLDALENCSDQTIFIMNKGKLDFLTNKSLNSDEFSRCILKYSLQNFGFVGHYIFPSCLIKGKEFHKDSVDRWPHLHLLFQGINNSFQFKKISKVLVIQAPDNVLTWKPSGWAFVKFLQVKTLFNSLDSFSLRFFLALRCIFSLSLLKTIVLWRIESKNNFNKDARLVLKELKLRDLNGSKVINLLIITLFYIVRSIPLTMIRILFIIALKHNTFNRIYNLKSDDKNDGMVRG